MGNVNHDRDTLFFPARDCEEFDVALMDASACRTTTDVL